MMSRDRNLFCAVMVALVLLASPAFAEEESSPGSLRSLQAQALSEAVQLSAAGDTLTFVAPLYGAAGELRPVQAPQDDPRHEGVGIGFKIGPIFASKLSFEGGPSFDSKNGYMLGIFFGGNRPGIVGVMGELMYAKKTVATSGLTAGDTILQYFEIPILLRVNAGSNSLNGILGYFLLGPVFDIRLSASLKESGFDVADSYEGFDIGLIVGGGVEITRFLVELRGNWGLRNIGKDLTSAQEIKTKSIALLFGVRFN